MARILRDASHINKSHRVEQFASVFVKQNVGPDRIAYCLDTNALCLEGRDLWSVIQAFDSAIFHEVHLDIADAPIDEGRVCLS